MRGPTIAPILTKSRNAMSAPPAAFKTRIVVTPAASVFWREEGESDSRLA
jgi:hypothetical protein